MFTYDFGSAAALDIAKCFDKFDSRVHRLLCGLIMLALRQREYRPLRHLHGVVLGPADHRVVRAKLERDHPLHVLAQDVRLHLAGGADVVHPDRAVFTAERNLWGTA